MIKWESAAYLKCPISRTSVFLYKILKKQKQKLECFLWKQLLFHFSSRLADFGRFRNWIGNTIQAMIILQLQPCLFSIHLFHAFFLKEKTMFFHDKSILIYFSSDPKKEKIRLFRYFGLNAKYKLTMHFLSEFWFYLNHFIKQSAMFRSFCSNISNLVTFVILSVGW